jgi:broad specificity phosphatase PhoE
MSPLRVPRSGSGRPRGFTHGSSQDLEQKVADGETGHQVVARMAAAFRQIADEHPGDTVAVDGHVAGLNLALAFRGW